MDKEQLIGLAKQAYVAYMNAQHAQAQGNPSQQSPAPHPPTHAYSDEGSQTDDPPAYDTPPPAPRPQAPTPQPHPQAQSQSHLSPEQADEGAHAARIHAQSPIPPDNPLAGALGMLMQHLHEGSHQVPVDEEHVEQAHAQAYKQGNAGGMSASSMGTAAAVQIFQKLSSHGDSSGGGGSPSSQAELIHLAMSEAAKLFDKSGGAASGNKQEAINNAAMTVMKLLVQAKSGGAGAAQGGGAGGSSTVQGLMALAQKFAH